MMARVSHLCMGWVYWDLYRAVLDSIAVSVCKLQPLTVYCSRMMYKRERMCVCTCVQQRQKGAPPPVPPKQVLPRTNVVSGNCFVLCVGARNSTNVLSLCCWLWYCYLVVE